MISENFRLFLQNIRDFWKMIFLFADQYGCLSSSCNENMYMSSSCNENMYNQGMEIDVDTHAQIYTYMY